MSKKVVLKVDLNDDKIRKKAMKAVSGFPGVESMSVDMKDQKLTLIGEIDPVSVVGKLRKLGRYAEIVSVGPAKEEKKKEEPKKEEPKKEGGDKKKDPNEELAKLVKAYEAYYYQMRPPYPYYSYTTVEENPNACVIC